MGDESLASVTAPVEPTVFNAISDLKKLSWRLNELVFGEAPVSESLNKEPQPADKLTFARNEITQVNSRLREIADRLELLGK